MINQRKKQQTSQQMVQLMDYTHPDVLNKPIEKMYKRLTARGIILKGDEILLIYTKRYDDYSFPGGGIDLEESKEEALIRELAEETGAQNVKILKPFGFVEELRPIHYPQYDAMHQVSYFYLCDADRELGVAKPESYELANGSEPVWVAIKEAIKHNKRIIEENPHTMGQSIFRETSVLEMVLAYSQA